jgi:hypothetical protein
MGVAECRTLFVRRLTSFRALFTDVSGRWFALRRLDECTLDWTTESAAKACRLNQSPGARAATPSRHVASGGLRGDLLVVCRRGRDGPGDGRAGDADLARKAHRDGLLGRQGRILAWKGWAARHRVSSAGTGCVVRPYDLQTDAEGSLRLKGRTA